jgi:hypothetical protein
MEVVELNETYNFVVHKHFIQDCLGAKLSLQAFRCI